MDQRRSDGAAGARRARALAPVLALALGLVAACATPAPAPLEPRDASADRGPTPTWAQRTLGSNRPLDWGTLAEIEDWLASSAAERSPYWRVEGHLLLAEGRLELARRDAGQVSADALDARRAAAREGFQLVLADARADAEQRVRARRGLDGAGPEPVHLAPHAEFLSRSQWGAESAVPARLNPVGGSWDRITIHHSAEVPGVSLDGSLQNSIRALRKIQRYQLHQLDWGDIGYHFLVDPEGRVFEGRLVRWQGAHAGDHERNRFNLGVCVLGDYSRRGPSPQATEALRGLLDRLRRDHGIARNRVYGHADLKNTECPGPHLARWLRGYAGGGSAIPASAPRGGSSVTRSAVPRTVERRANSSGAGSVR